MQYKDKSVLNHDGITVIVIFYNMQREARRTLFSLTAEYQDLLPEEKYEVIAVDNGSTNPIDCSQLQDYGPQFSYFYEDNKSCSPCSVINKYARKARFENLMIVIDGARILSPGILRLTMIALRMFPRPFVYTYGMHIGYKAQNYLVEEDYDKQKEDRLLESIQWADNGYSLFEISTPALSSKNGFFSSLSESNCFSLRKKDFFELGGFNTLFKTPGGGLCNLEFFNRANQAKWVEPVMLIGEATFHQFHGGVTTNVPFSQHPWVLMEKEYREIVGEPYKAIYKEPCYVGGFRLECASLYRSSE